MHKYGPAQESCQPGGMGFNKREAVDLGWDDRK